MWVLTPISLRWGYLLRESPLYPDFSIESRGMAILREIWGLRNGNAAILGFFRKNICSPHREKGSAGSCFGFGCKNPDKPASIPAPAFPR